MKSAIACSVAFMYVAYHMTSDSTKFGGEGIVKYVYYFLFYLPYYCFVIIIPLVLITYVLALFDQIIAKINICPVLLQVLYFMIAPYYV
jgi:putative membrane protein